MEHILPAYRDPLFGILLLIGAALVIAIASYGWGLYKQQKEEGKLHRFLQTFESKECALETETLAYDPQLLKPLTLLAKAFEYAGEYPKAIGIYRYLITHNDDEATRLELMEQLGSTYLKAGFLERAKQLFLEILRRSPRRKRVLSELGIVYERMQRFDEAKEVIEPLRELGVETETLEAFLDFLSLKHDKRRSDEEKRSAYIAAIEAHPFLYRPALEALFKIDDATAWRYVDADRFDKIADLMWRLGGSQLDLDIIAQHTLWQRLYFARGDRKEDAKEICGVFEIDLIATAKKGGMERIDLHFTYLCDACKQNFPVPFLRCPSCMQIGTLLVERHLAKRDDEAGHSLL